MDSLPVELLQLILEYCDPPSVRSLRLVSPTLAELGYGFLLPPVFTALPWRDDLARLRAIAGHDRLRSSIEAVTFNFTQVHVDFVHHSLYVENCRREHDTEQTALFRLAWTRFAECEQRRRGVPPLYSHDPADIAAALRPLSNLRDLAITFRRYPYDVDVLQKDLLVPHTWNMDHAVACKTLSVLLAALQLAIASPPGSPVSSSSSNSPISSSSVGSPLGSPLAATSSSSSAAASPRDDMDTTMDTTMDTMDTAMDSDDADSGGCISRSRRSSRRSRTPPRAPSLASFSVDRLPLEMFRQPHNRQLWFRCDKVFAGLTRLDLGLDSSKLTFPSSKFKAVNGLGYLLLQAPHLTHLSLAFHNHTQPSDKFVLFFHELLGESSSSSDLVAGGGGDPMLPSRGFAFRSLTDLKLEGIACDGRELRAFLLRHAATLQRLRLGGRGLVRNPCDDSRGGIRLFDGSFRQLFYGMRSGLRQLQRLHLEGDFDCRMDALSHDQDTVPGGGVGGGGDAGGAANGDGAAGAGAGEAGAAAANGETTNGHAAAHATTHTAHPGLHLVRFRYESYHFRATTDDDWHPVTDTRSGPASDQAISSLPFEQFVLGQTDEYPGAIRL